MTHWSRWITDRDDVQITLPSGPAEVYGDSTFSGSGPVDSPAFAYREGVGNSIGGAAAATEAATIGVDCASMFAGPFSPVAHTAAIPPNYLPLWDGSWRWENPYGTIPGNATATFVLHVTGAGAGAFSGEYFMWLDDEMDFSSGHMTGPEYDPATLTSRWVAAPVRTHQPLTIAARFQAGISIAIPVSMIVARGYKFAVTIAVSPSSDGLDLSDPQFESLLDSFFLNPRFSIGLKSIPPLRYYPRDDAVGGSPRTNRSSTSRQSSARQGYTNTYR